MQVSRHDRIMSDVDCLDDNTKQKDMTDKMSLTSLLSKKIVKFVESLNVKENLNVKASDVLTLTLFSVSSPFWTNA